MMEILVGFFGGIICGVIGIILLGLWWGNRN